MDDDAPESEVRYRPAPKLSLTPSWVVLGFVLGGLTVWVWPPHRAEPAAKAAAARPTHAVSLLPLSAPKLATVEAVFEAWGKYAAWDHDLTQVALWNSDTESFSDCFEVLRVGDQTFFRSIPRLTRPVLVHGVADGSPLQFTETAEQKRCFLQEAAEENWRAVRESIQSRQSPSP